MADDRFEIEVEMYTSKPVAKNFGTDVITPSVDLLANLFGKTNKPGITKLPGLRELRKGANPLALQKVNTMIVFRKNSVALL